MRFFRTPWIVRRVFPRRTWKYASSDTVYLTFDDGPTQGLTSWILQLLEERSVKATFFCVGANAKKLPELMEAIRSQGHVVGNHTMRHEKGTEQDYMAYRTSVDEAAPFTDEHLFRPPYGRLPAGHARKIGQDYRIVMWTWLSYDFDPAVSVQRILQQAEKIRPGDVLVLHDNEKVQERVKELLPALLDLLEKKGYRFGLISA